MCAVSLISLGNYIVLDSLTCFGANGDRQGGRHEAQIVFESVHFVSGDTLNFNPSFRSVANTGHEQSR